MAELIDFLFNKLASLFTSNLSTQVTTLIAWLTHLFMGGFSMYIGLLTFNIWRGGLDEGIGDIVKRAMGWLIIIALGLNIDNYMGLANAIYSAPEQLATYVSGSSVSGDQFQILASQLKKILATISGVIDDSSMFGKVLPLFAYGVTMILGYIVIFVFLAMYLLAKFSLALVLIFGPIFISLMLFPGTRQYGMNWIGQCINYVLTVALYSGAITIQQVAFAYLKIKDKPNVGDVLEFSGLLLALTVILIPVALSIPSIAGALSGGASISAGTKLSFGSFANPHGKTLGAIKSTGKGIGNIAKYGYNKLSGK